MTELEAIARSDEDSRRKQEAVTVNFSGRTGEYFQIWLVNTALTLASVGLYMPWARVRTRRYFLGQIRLQESGLDYQANPRAMFFGWVVIGLGFTLLSSFGDLLTMGLTSAVQLWVKGSWIVPLLSAGVVGVILLIQLVTLSWLLVQSLRYNSSMTSYRNLRFGFGNVEARFNLCKEMVILLLLRFLVPISLGLLQPYAAWRWRRFLIRHRRFGTTPFAFTAKPSDFRRLHLRALPLLLPAIASIATLLLSVALAINKVISTPGVTAPSLIPSVILTVIAIAMAIASIPLLLIWSCWLEARAASLSWRCTHLGELRFACAWRARDLIRLRLLHGLALVFSLGLAWPWVRIRETRYRLQRISVSPAKALDGFLAGEQERISALAEGSFAMDDAMAGLIDISL
ncbi:MAG: YjgN family protein [Cyanobacteriota bacterium]